MERKELVIGNLRVRIPVIQGGMGVGVSLSGLAGAVAAAGGVGVISTAQIGFREPDYDDNPLACNLRAVGKEIKKARQLADGGVIAVNIMVATQDYEEYVKAAVDAEVDLIISGAGLPMQLPKLVEGSAVKIAPIVSSKNALAVITKYWKKKFDRLPDLVVIEGPKAGGHLGFTRAQIEEYTDEGYDKEIVKIIELAGELEAQYEVSIPVVVAGGIYSKEDMEHYLALGANGVQMGTRFVTTIECDASDSYKQAYLDATKEDIVIVDSPVGMPGRAIRNEFLERVKNGERFMDKCRRCISTCKPQSSPYCISRALINAVTENLSEGLLFCGSNAYRAKRLETVREIMEEFDIWQ
ncbi:MAG: nitronate monooxygenase [Lachnospiraceae bacterium]|nr:nitronate monooxygenase [Lachnospiraceae bacterium]